MAYDKYLTYDEYVGLGGTLPASAFTLLEFKARKRIDYLTASRVQNMAQVPIAVKLCMLSIMELDSAAGAEAQAKNPVVTSFNTDGYSESYGKAMGVEDVEKSITGVIKTGLFGELDDHGTPLLYRGVG